MKDFILKHRIIIILVLGGVLFRLLFVMFFSHIFDFRNILAIMKSVADTGDLTEGFFVVKRNGFEIQLYGKIFYQIGALWLRILHQIGIININYLFDNQPFQVSSGYMIGFLRWDPQLYQQIAIKLSQFLYDFIFLFFFYRLASLVSHTRKHLAVLFWAFNPFIVFVSYAMYQADLAMLAFLTGGIYFAILSFSSQTRPSVRLCLAALSCFALGAVIKQLPSLMIPFILILFSDSILSFFGYLLSFVIFYGVFSQPWASDTGLIKQFLINSRESLALFNYQLNSVSIFLLLYTFLVGFFFFFKNIFVKQPLRLIYLAVAILILVYIGEDNAFLFPQFNIWIMPFIFLISLEKEIYLIFLTAPIIGFFKRSMIDNDFLTGAFSQTFGTVFADLPKYQHILHFAFNTILVDYVLTTIMIAIYIMLFLFIIRDLDLFHFQRLKLFNQAFFKKKFVNLIIIFMISYFVVLAGDYIVKSRLVVLRGGTVQGETKEISLNGNKLTLDIKNPLRRTVNAIELKALRKRLDSDDYLVLNFTDATTNRLLFEQKVSDYLVPDKDEPLIILLKKGVNSPHFRLQLSKEKNQNNIVVYFASIATDPKLLTVTEEVPLAIDYNGTPFNITLRGQDPILHSLSSFRKNISQKPTFFFAYFTLIVSIAVSIIVISKSKLFRKF